MTCAPTLLGPGVAMLSADDLETLDLTCDDGFVLVGFQVGFPAERPVVRFRALSDGVFDDTLYLGQRAVTITLRLDHRVDSTQTLLDRLRPFLSPRRRVTFSWAQPQTPTELRSLTLRGVDAPLVITGPKYLTVTCSWVSTGSFLLDPVVNTAQLNPNEPESEGGRTYPLTFDREYSPIPPPGSIYVYNAGTAPANWTMSLRGGAVDPTIQIRTSEMIFASNGGVTLATGETLDISTADRTIVQNGDPSQSRLDRVNFLDWTWDDLLFQPGDNVVGLSGSGFDYYTLLTISWQDTYL